MPRLKLYQDIDVTLGDEILTQHRAEEGKLADMVSSAELLKLLLGDANMPLIHSVTFSIRGEAPSFL
jgi:hypothetical protein